MRACCLVRLRIPRKLEEPLLRSIPVARVDDLGRHVRRILVTGMHASVVQQEIRDSVNARGSRVSRLPQVELVFTVQSNTERRNLLTSLASAAGHISATLNLDRPVEVRELVAAIIKVHVAGKLQGIEEISPTTQAKDGTSSPVAGRGKRSKARRRRRSKSTSRTRREPVKPHPECPEVQLEPSQWQPGKRGRPPLGAKLRANGSWKLPRGFVLIDGLWHAPMPEPAGFRRSKRAPANVASVARTTKKRRNDGPSRKEDTLDQEARALFDSDELTSQPRVERCASIPAPRLDESGRVR